MMIYSFEDKQLKPVSFFLFLNQSNSVSLSNPAWSFKFLHCLPKVHFVSTAWRAQQVGLLFQISFLTQGKKTKPKQNKQADNIFSDLENVA